MIKLGYDSSYIREKMYNLLMLMLVSFGGGGSGNGGEGRVDFLFFFYLRMICVKFYLNWFCGFGEEGERGRICIIGIIR